MFRKHRKVIEEFIKIIEESDDELSSEGELKKLYMLAEI